MWEQIHCQLFFHWLHFTVYKKKMQMKSNLEKLKKNNFFSFTKLTFLTVDRFTLSWRDIWHDTGWFLLEEKSYIQTLLSSKDESNMNNIIFGKKV